MPDLTEIQAALPVKIIGSDNVGSEGVPVASDANGNMKVLDYASSATGSTVPVSASFMGARNPSGNLVGLLTDGSSYLYSNVQASALPAGASTETTLAAVSAKFNNDYGVSSSAIRVASQIGNAAGAASFGAGTTTAQTLRVVLPTDQNLTINQGTPASIASSWAQKITDGINGPVAVKAASAVPLASDLALVVTISPNSASLNISSLPTTSSKFSFGDITTAAQALVAVERTIYSEQTTNAAMTLVSSNAADTAAGTGTRSVLVTYYDQTMAGPFVTTIILNGTTAATASVSNMCFIEKMVVSTVGTGTSNAGTLTLKSGAATVGTIAIGDNQTFWAHHYVPIGKTSYISGFSTGSSSTVTGGGAALILKASQPTVANSVEFQISDFVTLYGQSSTNTRTYLSPIQVAGPARVRAYVIPTTSTSIIYRASFDFIDN